MGERGLREKRAEKGQIRHNGTEEVKKMREGTGWGKGFGGGIF